MFICVRNMARVLSITFTILCIIARLVLDVVEVGLGVWGFLINMPEFVGVAFFFDLECVGLICSLEQSTVHLIGLFSSTAEQEGLSESSSRRCLLEAGA